MFQPQAVTLLDKQATKAHLSCLPAHGPSSPGPWRCHWCLWCQTGLSNKERKCHSCRDKTTELKLVSGHAGIDSWVFLYLQLPDGRLSLLDQPQVVFSDGLSLSLHLVITAGTHIDEIKKRIRRTVTEMIGMINDNKWTYLGKGDTFPKLSSGCPPCQRKLKGSDKHTVLCACYYNCGGRSLLYACSNDSGCTGCYKTYGAHDHLIKYNLVKYQQQSSSSKNVRWANKPCCF